MRTRATLGFGTTPDCNGRIIELAKRRFAINQDDIPATAPAASIVGLKVENPASPAVRREAEEEWGVPPPGTFEEANNACFVVRDANRFAVSYVYFESERRTAANLMTRTKPSASLPTSRSYQSCLCPGEAGRERVPS